MKLLRITDKEPYASKLEAYFEESTREGLKKVSPKIIDNQSDVRLTKDNLDNIDAVYAEIPVENAVFGRVLLEMIEERAIPLNYSSTAFFSMAKKNYLYHVLHEKNVSAPKTSIVADKRAARNLENHLKGPLIAREFEEFSQVERKKIDKVEEIEEFSKGIEYGENYLIFQEYSKGDKYRCLVAGDKIISLEDNSDTWDVTKESLRYSNIPKKVRKAVKKAKKALGTTVAEVIVRDNQIIDIHPNPDLELYEEVSGKDVYKNLAEAIKEEAI